MFWSGFSVLILCLSNFIVVLALLCRFKKRRRRREEKEKGRGGRKRRKGKADMDYSSSFSSFLATIPFCLSSSSSPSSSSSYQYQALGRRKKGRAGRIGRGGGGGGGGILKGRMRQGCVFVCTYMRRIYDVIKNGCCYGVLICLRPLRCGCHTLANTQVRSIYPSMN